MGKSRQHRLIAVSGVAFVALLLGLLSIRLRYELLEPSATGARATSPGNNNAQRTVTTRVHALPPAQGGEDTSRLAAMKRANSIDPDAAAMLNRLRDAGHLSSITPLLTPKDEVKERNGVFGYTGHGYLLTADREGITAALPTKLRDGKRPTLSISMSEIKVGDTVISYGGHGIPELRANERTLYYKRGSVEERYVLRRGVFEQDFVISELPPGRGPIVAKSKVQSNLVHLAGRLAMNAG